MTQGRQAFAAKDFAAAEVAFARAAHNVDIGLLGNDAKARSLYNLGESKRLLNKFAEAESMFLQAESAAVNTWKEDSTERLFLNAGFLLLYRDMHEFTKAWPYLRKTFGPLVGKKYAQNINWIKLYTDYELEFLKMGMRSEAKTLKEEIEKLKTTEPNQSSGPARIDDSPTI